MLTFKPFYIHYHSHQIGKTKQELRKPRGFTALVTPSQTDHHLNVQLTFCSSHDNFGRKKGRELTEKKTPQEILAKDLPKFLQMQRKKCFTELAWFPDYNYTLKYVV